MPDEDGYPTNQELTKIKKWSYTDRDGLLKYIADLWSYPDRVRVYRGKNIFGQSVKKLYLSTGGWSGNEDIIQALKTNFMFWSICWLQSKRGGHYWFEIRKQFINRKGLRWTKNFTPPTKEIK